MIATPQGALLYEGAGVLCIDKPAGVSVIPGRGNPGPCLLEQWQGSLKRKLWVVHRLDRDTSGALLFALNAQAHRELSMAFEAGKVSKRYLALVEGELPASIEATFPLVPARRSRMRVAREGETGKAAHTTLRPVERLGRATLVEALPFTGRTHQIRVHLMALGHPLLVDHQYGRGEPLMVRELGGEGTEVVLARTPLHAAQLEIPKLEFQDALTVNSPLPEDMRRALDLLRGAQAVRSDPGAAP